ncbi:hypothetical protein TELCIR_24927, partial [Teladorsagia circumcincta]
MTSLKGSSEYFRSKPEEGCLMSVTFRKPPSWLSSCDVFDCGREDPNNDRITVEWCNTPDGAAIPGEWFQGD